MRAYPLHTYQSLFRLVTLLLMFIPIAVSAAPEVEDKPATPPVTTTTLDTLASFDELRSSLVAEIRALTKKIAAATTEEEKAALRLQLEKLDANLRAVTTNFENVAAGVDTTDLHEKKY
jgi:hypothetical protein